jgi:hypothetical protein
MKRRICFAGVLDALEEHFLRVREWGEESLFLDEHPLVALEVAPHIIHVCCRESKGAADWSLVSEPDAELGRMRVVALPCHKIVSK